MANEKRLIYAEDALAAEFSIEADGAIGYVVDSEVIRRLPTVDAVPVVRCKDCKNFKFYRKTSLLANGQNVPAGWCMKWAKDDSEHRALPGDFCSYGERRTDG